MSATSSPNTCPFCSQWNPPVRGIAKLRCRFCNNALDADEDATVRAVGPAPTSRAAIPITQTVIAGSVTRAARPSAGFGNARSIGERRPAGRSSLSVSLPLIPLVVVLVGALAVALLARVFGWF